MSKRRALLALAFAALPSLAYAHAEGGAHTHTFLDGALHPLGGLDHLLVMLAVGLWAIRIGSKAIWLMPSAFVSGMAIGMFGGASMLGPIIEPAIALTTIVLGLALAFAFRPALGVAAALIVPAGFFHGAAHVADAAGQAGIAFAIGALMMTMVLHALGVVLGLSAASSAGSALSSTRSRA